MGGSRRGCRPVGSGGGGAGRELTSGSRAPPAVAPGAVAIHAGESCGAASIPPPPKVSLSSVALSSPRLSRSLPAPPIHLPSEPLPSLAPGTPLSGRSSSTQAARPRRQYTQRGHTMVDAEEVNFVKGGEIEAHNWHCETIESDDVKGVLSARQGMAVAELADSSISGTQNGIFPGAVWKKILSNIHPFELVRISTTARFILDLLCTYDEVLRCSRSKHMPELPAPIPKLSEWDMLNLLYGSGCKMCQTTEATTCWSFRTRLCRSCLLQNSKNVRLPS